MSSDVGCCLQFTGGKRTQMLTMTFDKSVHANDNFFFSRYAWNVEVAYDLRAAELGRQAPWASFHRAVSDRPMLTTA